MKKLALLVMIIFLSWHTNAAARNNGLNGLLLGAGGGALIGQAIEHNTEATLIGTAVGTMFGDMIGNEMDKGGGPQVYTYTTHRRPYAPPVVRRTYYRRVPVEEYREPVCRRTEILAKIDGEAEKVFGVACLEDGNWVLRNDGEITVDRTIILEEWERPRHRVSHHRHHRRHDKVW